MWAFEWGKVRTKSSSGTKEMEVQGSNIFKAKLLTFKLSLMITEDGQG